MNDHSETVLDYTRIRSDLQGATVTPMGRDLAAHLSPMADVDALMVQQRETSEVVERLSADDAPPVATVVDLHPYLATISIDGFYLDTFQLLDIATCLESVQRLRRYAQDVAHQRLLVTRRLNRLTDFGILLREIRSAIDEQGHVRDHASSALMQTRQALRGMRERIQRRLQELLSVYREVVQDAIITIRNDRFVIPLKADFPRALRGIVHGESSSGATIYVEPEAIVPLNNQLLHEQAQEERAIREVLRDLTARVAVQRVGLAQALQIIGEVDLMVAKGRLSLRMQGAAPRFVSERRLQLRAARHPLIADPVPIDVSLGPDDRTLVITGPNTGGKTAVLKTVGLLVLMAQAGLHIPASADSVLPVFTEVFVDVGDEQSLQQNLSTFSAHLSNIGSILQEVTPCSLVLLDELGAGTDPMEGGPLGVALLERFHQSEAMTLATTHHSMIKTYAVATAQVACAAVDFDVETLAPRYRLVYGLPGRSQAFDIAERLGVPRAIIERAQLETSLSQTRSEQLLAQLESHRQQLESEQQRLDGEREDIDRLQIEAQTLLAQAKVEDRRVREALQIEGQTLLKTVRQELDATLAHLRRQGGEAVVFPHDAWQQAEAAVTSLSATPETESTPGETPFEIGDVVRVRGLINIVGRVAGTSGASGMIQVEAGDKRFTVSEADLERAEASAVASTPSPKRRPRRDRRRRDVQASLASELRLLGATVDEALPAVEQYLERALGRGMSRVRIIHGVGTGRLRDAITELLRRHPQVRGFQAGDAGGGSTVVELEGWPS
jgi:DNA mismatch repair protein MutS2